MADCLYYPDKLTERTLTLPKTTPLVGFHAMTDMDGLENLGLILLDKSDKAC
jgi:hypothetical protein